MNERDRDETPKPLTGRQAYNLVTDTVAGPNLRLKDNLYQGLAVLICALVGAGVGMIVEKDVWVGAFEGGLIGAIAGLFASGLFLMIFRAKKHASGEHD